MKILVVGMGSAGQRHYKMLSEMGQDVKGVDPARESDYSTIWDAMTERWDAAVVATPPATHLQMIRVLQKNGIRQILCEKPLCSWGQLDQVEMWHDVRVAFNYRFCKSLMALGTNPGVSWGIVSVQSRKRFPPWGLLLDHVSHDVDILVWKAGPISVTGAREVKAGPLAGWKITGFTRLGKPVFIFDMATEVPGFSRFSYIVRGNEAYPIPAHQTMYQDMLKSWLSGSKQVPGIGAAWIVQNILEAIRLIAVPHAVPPASWR